jgi:hypothetical protein
VTLVALSRRHLWLENRDFTRLCNAFAFWHDGCIIEGVLRDRGEKKMTTKINLNAEMENLSRRETLVRDSKNVRVKTAVRAGMLKRG